MSKQKKIDRIEGVLRQRSLNLFEAAGIGEYSLAETVFRLRARGVPVVGIREAIPNSYGTVTHVMRYRIVP